MSRWWKLPEELGSGVFRETGRFQSLIDLKVPGREGHMVVPSGWLTEAEEPAPKVAVVPPEPGAGSVVVDRDGDAWQRNAVRPNSRDSWNMAGDEANWTWPDLNEFFGPLKVVYEAEERG
jgi:hypothetical protein